MSDRLPDFLSLSDVLEIHEESLALYGGMHGVRDENGLESAVSQPMAGHSGGFFHDEPFGMAAAYLYYIAASQHFNDGNKRAALACALVFLERYEIEMAVEDEGLLAITMAVASGDATLAEVRTALEEAAERHSRARE